MPVSSPLKKQDVSVTRERLLEAAMKIFARDGLHRATTRVIAVEAGVNEVTLFRHFQNKDGLLAEVMRQVVETQAKEYLGEEDQWTGDLRENLRRFGHGLYHKMTRDEAFIRTMVGEARRHPDHARKIVKDAVKPMRTRFINHLETARRAGLVRKGIDLSVAADTFTGMLLGGMLRITADCADGYGAEQYVDTCVDLFAAGLAAAPKA